MLLLLDIQHGPILERPFHNIRLWGSTLDDLALVELGPESGEVLEFDQVPDLGEGGGYDGGFADGS